MTHNIKNIQVIFSISLMIILMVLTRGHNYWLSSLIHLPDFTIPALLIAGIYFRHWSVALILIITAVAIDNYAIVYKGVSANCITPAYSILPLIYYGVFYSGKFIQSLSIYSMKTFRTVAGFVLIVTALEWLLATSSYYIFTSSSWANFPSYIAHWAPVEIIIVLEWMVVTIILFSLNYRFNFVPFFKKIDL